MPRLFVGLEMPAETADALAALAGGVRGARWIERSDYHLTLRFIGDVGDDRARALEETLGGVSSPAFSLRLSGVDWFGGRKPRAIFAGVERNDALVALRGAVERACVSAGMEPERRRFSPHVTIARCRGASLREVRRFVSAHGLFSAGPFAVRRFVLFSARPSRGGGPYVTERAWPLR